jgi:hypothetical protein
MITVESAESALKNIYLDVVVNDINTKTNPFLTMVGKNTKTVSGKEIKCPIRYGDEGNVAAVREDGDLPRSTNSKYAEISVPLKNLYGTFQISDKAIRASQNNAGAFANLLSGEMQNLVSTAQANLNRMIYGNGMQVLSTATSYNPAAKTFVIPARYAAAFVPGAHIAIYDANNVKLDAGNMRVTSVTGSGSALTVTCSDDAEGKACNGDRFYVTAGADEGLELNGIDSIFFADKIYNLPTAEHKGITPCVVTGPESGDAAILDEEAILAFFDQYEEHCQGNPADIILTGPNVRKALFENLKDFRSNVDVTEMAGGFKGFSFNGIPLYSDVKCKGGTLYALNSDSFAMHQLCDWTWLEGDDGSILRQVDGKAAYSATLVKYADLICEKPFLQGKVTGYSALRYKA